MPQPQTESLSVGRIVLLFALFFAICLGLGYPILNRIEWQRGPGGLIDLQQYAKLVTGPPVPNLQQHTQFRVLVPYVARPFYHLALNHFGSWDPVMFGLLVANSLFVAGTVTLLIPIVLKEVGSYQVALGTALLYLLNFAVPNSRVIGFVDSGEAFFLVLVLWSLIGGRYYLLPLWALLGITAKETFVVFLVTFAVGWWLGERRKQARARSLSELAWIGASGVVGLTALAMLQWSITGLFRSPWRFGMEMHASTSLLSHVLMWLHDRNLYYTFIWLLPLGLPRINRFPLSWRLATAATSISAFALDAYYGAAPGTMARAQFTIAGPLLTASVAWLLFEPEARSAQKL